MCNRLEFKQRFWLDLTIGIFYEINLGQFAFPKMHKTGDKICTFCLILLFTKLYNLLKAKHVCVCVRACVCMRACVRMCVRACACFVVFFKKYTYTIIISKTYELSLCSIYQTWQMYIYCIVTMYFVNVLK